MPSKAVPKTWLGHACPRLENLILAFATFSFKTSLSSKPEGYRSSRMSSR